MHAWREVRLQWLRVQEAFVLAEAQGLDQRVDAMQKRSASGCGGGTAVLRMLKRQRQLTTKLRSIEADKREVKRSARLEHVTPSGLST
mmetsp:Transcript_35931/g.81537  ORF Transcript_35931/g.81537 Transcript_35931/m.81537 type:complete len:88 (-) Transcript_35931:337-600(-)